MNVTVRVHYIDVHITFEKSKKKTVVLSNDLSLKLDPSSKRPETSSKAEVAERRG